MGTPWALCVGSLTELAALRAGLPDPAWIPEAPTCMGSSQWSLRVAASPVPRRIEGSSGSGCRGQISRTALAKCRAFHPELANSELGRQLGFPSPDPSLPRVHLAYSQPAGRAPRRKESGSGL